ncbi:hypothetical protein Hanom_Chr13g01219861 [Helianthus anomalus]
MNATFTCRLGVSPYCASSTPAGAYTKKNTNSERMVRINHRLKWNRKNLV